MSFAVRDPISAQDDVREFHHVVWQQRSHTSAWPYWLDRGWGGASS
jgi:hypothetical protein